MSLQSLMSLVYLQSWLRLSLGLERCYLDPDVRTVSLEVSSRKETDRRLLQAFEGRPQGEIISFETPAFLTAA
jgi:hypothetical protein